MFIHFSFWEIKLVKAIIPDTGLVSGGDEDCPRRTSGGFCYAVLLFLYFPLCLFSRMTLQLMLVMISCYGGVC